MSTTKRVIERLQFTGGKVRTDGAYPVIEGVRLCGYESRNGRTYLPVAFRAAATRYEGRPVYVNHTTGERSAESKIAWVENVRLDPAGLPVGDLGVNPEHPLAKSVLWAAANKPGFYGMSHVAECRTRYDAGREVVEEVLTVESVDLVASPATTKGFYESTGGPPVTLKTYLESLAARPLTPAQAARVKRLAEMDGMGDPPMPADAPAPEEADPHEAITAGFATACTALITAALAGDMEPKEALKKLKSLIDSHGTATDKGGGKTATPEPEEDPADDAKDKPMESAKPADPWTVLAECQVAGFTPTPTQLKAMALLPAADRKAFVAESAAARPAERPTSAGRHRADALAESAARTAPGGVPTTANGFAKWFTEAE